MKKIFRLCLILLVVPVLCGIFACKNNQATDGETDYDKIETVSGVDTKLKIYEGPSYSDNNFYEFPGVNISVNNQRLFTYTTKVNHNRMWSSEPVITDAPMAYFDFQGEVEIKINIPQATVNTAVVRPLGFGITPDISADSKTLTFKINRPSQYVIEYNGDYKTAIHLFANPMETDVPDPDNLPENMVYFGPGVYRANAIPTEPGTTVYIAGGAVVYGQIRADRIDNLTIRGRGILDGTIYSRNPNATVPIDVMNSKNLKVEGIIISNPAGWTLNCYFVEDAKINNVKIITSRSNGDGITLQSCKKIEITDCFVRGWDDALVVKNYARGTTDNIVFNNCIIWTDLAQSTEIGYETNGETMKNIMFRNITVLHNFHKPVMSIHNSDDAVISDIKFINYTVEDAEMGEGDGNNYLIDFNIAYSREWSSVIEKRGKIDKVEVNNVLVLNGKSPVSNIKGFNKDYQTTNVSINNVKILDKEVKTAEDGNIGITANSTKNISVNYKTAATGAVLTAKKYIAASAAADIKTIPNISNQTSYIIPDFAKIVVPEVNVGANMSAGAVTGDYVTGHGAELLADGNSNTYWKSSTTPAAIASRAIVTVDVSKDAPVRYIKFRLPGDVSENSKFMFNLYGIKDGQDTSATGTLIMASTEAAFDPTEGNLRIFELSGTAGYRYYKFGFYNCSLGQVTVGELELYAPSLSLYKAVTASGYEDVYVASNAVDGSTNSYWEGTANTYPSHITVNLEESYSITSVVLALNPSALWQKRTQEIAIQGSADGINFTDIVAKKAYVFDPKEGNIVEITITGAESYQYIRFIGYSNTGWKSFQLAEINIYNN